MCLRLNFALLTAHVEYIQKQSQNMATSACRGCCTAHTACPCLCFHSAKTIAVRNFPSYAFGGHSGSNSGLHVHDCQGRCVLISWDNESLTHMSMCPKQFCASQLTIISINKDVHLEQHVLFILFIANDHESCADVPVELVSGFAVGQSHEEEARWRGGSRDVLQNGERCFISAWIQNHVHSQPMCTMWPFGGLTVTKPRAPFCHFVFAVECLHVTTVYYPPLRHRALI